MELEGHCQNSGGGDNHKGVKGTNKNGAISVRLTAQEFENVSVSAETSYNEWLETVRMSTKRRAALNLPAQILNKHRRKEASVDEQFETML